MRVRAGGLRIVRMAGAGVVLTLAAFFVPFGGSAFAQPAVTLSPGGPYSSGATINVSGTGFPSITADPSGLSIIECSDPDGTTANLPVTAASCDASTENPLPISQNSSGTFGPVGYQIEALSTSGGSDIDCGDTAATECVLWTGVDFNNSFTSDDAFSSPFEVTTPVASTPETPLAVALPVGAALLVGGAVFVARRRRRPITVS